MKKVRCLPFFTTYYILFITKYINTYSSDEKTQEYKAGF
jgi:hypothetical protein